MLNLPKTTEFNKRIPKEKFYENLNVSPTTKKYFVDQIKVIYWRNKIAPSTINLAKGNTVAEIEIFEIKLKTNHLDESVLRQMDREIPYHIVFLLEYESKYQAWVGYKEATESGNNAFKVKNYYHTGWMSQDELNFKVEGLNMDTVWENFIIQVGGVEVGQGKSLDKQIRLDEQKAKLQREIEKLEKQARNEKQPNKKFALVQRIKQLRLETEEENNG